MCGIQKMKIILGGGASWESSQQADIGIECCAMSRDLLGGQSPYRQKEQHVQRHGNR